MARNDRDERIRRMREQEAGREAQGWGNVTPFRAGQPGTGARPAGMGGQTPGQMAGQPGQMGGMPGQMQGMPGQMAGRPEAGMPMGAGRPGQPGGMPGQMAGRPAGTAGGMGTGRPGQDVRAVRSPEEEDAYQTGMRMGAEGLIQDAGMGRDAEAEEAQKGIDREKLLEADRILLEYKAGKASVDRRIIHAQQWWKLRNWHEISREKGNQGPREKKSATAWLWNCIVGKHADAMDSFPEPVILPRMMDDRGEAKKLSEIVPVVMQMNGFEETFSLGQWQKMQEGTAGYGVFWDKTKMNGMGDIAIRKINILNLFWEPGITDIQDSKNLFYVTFVDNDQLEGMYPQLKGKLKGNAMAISKYQTDDSVRLDEKSAVIDWYYHKWEGPRKVLHYCKYVGEDILYSTENNGDGRGLYDDGNYPFVLDPLYPVEGSPCGYGYIDIGKDAQADIDTLNEAMVMNAAASATPRYFMRKDGGINEEEFADLSKPIVHVGTSLGQDAIMPIQVNVMSGNAINMLQQKIDELKFVTGNTDINNGGTPAGVTAASAIAALKEDSGRSSKDSTRAAYRAYAKIVTMVIERIRQFYDIPRQFRILGQDGAEEFALYDNSGIVPQQLAGGLGLEDGYRMPVFDIEVRAQRENAYTKMSQNELALQFYSNGMFNPQMSDQALMCLDMMEFKGKDEISQKVRQLGTMQQALVQVGQIALALAQKYQPEVANQLAAQIQGVVGGMGGGFQPQGGGASLKGNAATSSQDAMKNGMNENENGIVRRAKERSAEATRPS